MRNKLLLLGVCALMCAALAANAWADKSGDNKLWNPIPQGTYSDVNESEPNDSFATADAVSCGDIYHATITTGGSGGDNDYIVFTTTATSNITFGTDADGASPVGDTVIYLYNSTFVQVGYSDDDGPGLYSLITYNNAPPDTYYGKIYAYGTYTGTYKAFVSCTVPEPPPPNDTCAGAYDIPCGPFSYNGTTQWATNNYSPVVTYPNGCTRFPEMGKDVVYKFTVSAGTRITANYTSSADGSIYIITDCADPVGTCVVGEDSTTSGGLEDIEDFQFTSAGTYYMILDSYGTDTYGTFTLTGGLVCPVATQKTSWGAIKSVYR